MVEMVKAGNQTILSIKVGVPEDEAADMPFLNSSSYDAIWYEAGCPMPVFSNTPATTTATMPPTSTTTESTTELGSGKFFGPCPSETACNEYRKKLGLERFEVGEFPSKGCFSKNGIAYWSTGGTAEEEAREDLPGIQERIWCDAEPESSPSPTVVSTTDEAMSTVPTTMSTEQGSPSPTAISTTDEAMSIIPTMVSTELGSGKLFARCESEQACDERSQQLGLTRFEVGEFPSKGCFSKNGTAYWSTGGTVEAEMREVLPGIQERIWCESGFSTRQTNTTCETGPSADPTKACGDGQFCALSIGVCNLKLAVFDGVCANKPEACTLNYVPVSSMYVSKSAYFGLLMRRLIHILLLLLSNCRYVVAMVRLMEMRARHEAQVLVWHPSENVLLM